MSQRAPKEQPPLKDLQRALAISAFDIAQNDGKITFQGCAELSNEESFRSQLPPPDPSYTRVLILEAPFSIDNPGVEEAMPDWFKRIDKLEPEHRLNICDSENLWTGKESHDPTRTFWTHNDLVVEQRVMPPGDSFIQKTAYLEAGKLFMGAHQSSTVHIWRYSVSVNAIHTENGALELTCRFPLIPEYYHMAVIHSMVLADPNTMLAAPLKSNFLTRLLAKDSATQSCCHDRETSAMAVLMDLLMASVDCQTSSMALFSDHIPRELQDLPVIKSPSVIHIVAKARILEENVRHIQEWLAISIGSKQSTDGLRNRRIKILNRYIESRLAKMNLHIRLWIELIDLSVSNTAAYLDGVQAQSVKRLTLLATVFLPISLAASLLSMSTRAADLGDLWYDYFGISAIALFLVSTGYYCLLLWDQIRRVEMSGVAPLEVFHSGLYYVKIKWLGYWIRPLLFFAFAALALASFVIGMAKSISLGLHTLAYSAAATLGPLLILSFIDNFSATSTEGR